MRRRRSVCEDPAAGGCVTFEGWVRNHNDARPVTRLDYQAYGPLAEDEGEAILEEARAKFRLRAARCAHRTGSLAIGELAVWIGVSADHRDAAFASLPLDHRRGEAARADLEEPALRRRRDRLAASGERRTRVTGRRRRSSRRVQLNEKNASENFGSPRGIEACPELVEGDELFESAPPASRSCFATRSVPWPELVEGSARTAC